MREEMADAMLDKQRILDDARRYDRDFSADMKLQCMRPQSIAFLLADSPVGMAS